MLRFFNKNFFTFSFGFVGMLLFGFFGVILTGMYEESHAQPESSVARDAVEIPEDEPLQSN